MIRWRVESDPATRGGIALLALAADDERELDGALESMGITAAVGAVRVTDLAGVDRGVVARWSLASAHLMPHGGPAIVRALATELARRFGEPVCPLMDTAALLALYPEAADELEARMLHTLASAASPMAIDLLLDQPRRWRALESTTRRRLESAPAGDPSLAPATLARLIHPPLVVALGAPNIGKSSLLNALAGRSVALVANEPGTTRDYVGVLLDLGGLVVRYADTPGIRDGGGATETDARTAALALARSADVLLLCGDATAPPPDAATLPHGVADPPAQDAAVRGDAIVPPSICVALRTDRGRPTWPHDAATSAALGHGLDGLARFITDRLVPADALADLRPWRFWD